MSYTTSWNYDSTGATPAVGTIQPQSLAYSRDFTKKSSTPNELVLVNTTSPMDRTETVQFAIQKIANVYSGSGLDSSVYAANKSGVSVLARVNDVLTVTDSVTNKVVYLPISAHVVLRVPVHEVIDASILQTLLERGLGTLYEESGSTAGPRLNNLVRGALTPSALA